jgi:cob(I)alamin adenosyltransferase
MLFINRLSDYFFTLARVVNFRNNIEEPFYEKSGEVFHEIKKEKLPKTRY